MIRFITLIAFALVSSTAIASPRAGTSWQDAVARAMADADPEGDWQRVAVEQERGAQREAEIVITIDRDGSTAAKYNGDVTLKRGIIAGTNPKGSQALLVATDILVCHFELGCVPFEGIALDEIDLATGSCVYPLCGGNLDVLVDASPAYLVVDVIAQRDGSTVYSVTDLIIGFEVALSGIEPDEID
jgi:hypothetical protein